MQIFDFENDQNTFSRETDRDWQQFEKKIKIGEQLSGTVIAAKEYGVFVDFGEPFPALVEVVNFCRSRYPLSEDDLPASGETMRLQVIQIVSHRRMVRCIESPRSKMDLEQEHFDGK